MAELNQQTSRVISEVRAGGRIDITMHGRVVASIVPATEQATWLERKKAEGKVTPPSDLDAVLPDAVRGHSGLSVDELIEQDKGDF